MENYGGQLKIATVQYELNVIMFEEQKHLIGITECQGCPVDILELSLYRALDFIMLSF